MSHDFRYEFHNGFRHDLPDAVLAPQDQAQPHDAVE